MAADVHQLITDSIIAAIETGAADFTLPWQRSVSALPANAATSKTYNGINILALWVSAMHRGYTHGLWATYRQWAALGAQVRKGEKASHVIFYKEYEVDPNPEDQADDGTRRVAKASYVFNVAQVDGYAMSAEAAQQPALERHTAVDDFITRLAPDLRIGGDAAYYAPVTDHIQMPDEWRFRNTDQHERSIAYYSTLLHELGHWTGHKSRLDRDLTPRFKTQGYAAEELVAELASAFMCAEFGISSTPRPDHAAYIKNWLQLLKDDNRAVFTAAAKASQAVTYLQKRAAETATVVNAQNSLHVLPPREAQLH